MKTVEGRVLDDLESATIESELENLLDAITTRTTFERDFLVVPDVGYPFHPSTGMVTDPAVVQALVVALRSEFPDADLGIAYVGTNEAAGRKTAELLDYDSHLEGRDVEIIDLDGAATVERVVRFDGGEHTVSIPEPLAKRHVIVVPTLRYDDSGRLAGGMKTVARSAAVSNVPRTVTAASLAIDPITILDGTYTFTGRPHRSELLLAGTDVVAVDTVASGLAGRGPDNSPSLVMAGADPGAITVRGVSVDSLRESFPNEGPPRQSSPGSLTAAGYRLYTRVSGDAYPPQFDR
ncbi:DUF362 domain-containing protein [Halosimplex amylolyticum]|uniref:DUF362 domain-containing protein n=1 Tax=Halosimplex amylolyticum TaxID=3396616 RepID=UPI003F549FD2